MPAIAPLAPRWDLGCRIYGYLVKAAARPHIM